jgi:hypothetical protein
MRGPLVRLAPSDDVELPRLQSPLDRFAPPMLHPDLGADDADTPRADLLSRKDELSGLPDPGLIR